ncbi:MAG: hypothetical protein BGO54_12280 [Sphingobacteriales bacterium 46-32]|nr:MAG: hypothetical protein BGO54_12280 [Sphingobacteriales bacterium 46-32]
MSIINKKSGIILLIIALVVIAGFYFLISFFSAFSPPKVTVTRDYISTNRNFVNGVTIEEIQVDSVGENEYPVKYTVLYSTSCNILPSKNKPTIPPVKIEFYKPGKYSWDENTIKVRYIHNGFLRQSLDTMNKRWWLNKFGEHSVCPLKFKQEQWYFITIGDPRITGLFFYIDKNNKEYQYCLESGVSPI